MSTEAARPIHVCGYCREMCRGDGTDEHVCGNDDCLSIHLPSPEALLAKGDR